MLLASSGLKQVNDLTVRKKVYLEIEEDKVSFGILGTLGILHDLGLLGVSGVLEVFNTLSVLGALKSF